MGPMNAPLASGTELLNSSPHALILCVCLAIHPQQRIANRDQDKLIVDLEDVADVRRGQARTAAHATVSREAD